MNTTLFDRDLSWLSFNERVLHEAAAKDVPLGDRLNFLSIYSSNLDEFYRVRMPALMVLDHLAEASPYRLSFTVSQILEDVKQTVQQQLTKFGDILVNGILPGLREQGIDVIYNQDRPEVVEVHVRDYFFNHVLGYLQPITLIKGTEFFPENNQIYTFVLLVQDGKASVKVINIPSNKVSRFFTVTVGERKYIIFLEDIITAHLDKLFPHHLIEGAYHFKVTRDAELALLDEFDDDIVSKLEKRIAKRDFGLATRVLTDMKMPATFLQYLLTTLHLENAQVVKGGTYHNLKDLASIPLGDSRLYYSPWKPLVIAVPGSTTYLFDALREQDILLHPPYHSYDTVVRFFNEAALDETVSDISVTLYRIAKNSRIGDALISAAKNGKKVTVMVELKARFDESNNIKWAKKMQAAGVVIHYSVMSIKVHAKIALVKRKVKGKTVYAGLLATGNLNEVTARFYTDHILLTSHEGILLEIQRLFALLTQKKSGKDAGIILFHHLLVAPFNLKEKFTMMIDREIQHARNGHSARITIKLNNLEEPHLINKLYEASSHGVEIHLIVRGICCLIPGVSAMSKNITVHRIVDRYLEHGRVFIFHHQGKNEVYMGSADWMNRNIYKRIEVCFPVYDEQLRQEMVDLIELQWRDNVKAVALNTELKNVPLVIEEPAIRSQWEIYQRLSRAE